MLCCYQVTKLFCSWNRSLIASSARNPRNFGSQAFVAISVFADSKAARNLARKMHMLSKKAQVFVRSVRNSAIS